MLPVPLRGSVHVPVGRTPVPVLQRRDLFHPYDPTLLPHVPTTVRIEGEADRFLPPTHHQRVVETRWNRLRERTARKEVGQ